MIPLTLGEKKFNLPSDWNDITVKQWLDLRSIDFTDICAILAVLTGIEREMWFTSTEISGIEEIILPQLQFLADPIDLTKIELQKFVTISGKEVEVPKDIGLKTYGQKIIFQQEMLKYSATDGNFKIEFMPRAIAIYMCPEPFTDIKAFEYEKEIERMKVVEAYPLASFFLSSLLKSWTGKARHFAPVTMQTNRGRGSRGWRSLVSKVLWWRSRAATS